MTTTAARARWAVTAVFLASGLTIATMLVRTPSLMLEHGLSEGQIGLTSTVFGLAALVSMQLVGVPIRRFGSSGVVRAAAVLLPVLLLAVGTAGGYRQLIVIFAAFGAVVGALDVAMNAHAVAVERALGRPIMNGCHAAWSIGAAAGSLLGGAAAQAGQSLATHFLWMGAVLLAVALPAGRGLLPADRNPAAESAEPSRRGPDWRTGWTWRVLLFGALGATVLICEASAGTWSGVFLHEELAAPVGVASLGYIAFAVCQTAGRLIGDRLHSRFGATALIRTGTLVAAAGLALALLGTSAPAAIAGFALMGAGLATPLPVIFSVVGHIGAREGGEGHFLARFATMTYTGMLLGPAVIGWLAETSGLAWTLAGLIPLLLAVASAAGRVDPKVRVA